MKVMVFSFALFLVVIDIAHTEDKRVCICTRVYRPVCGSDGMTYDNITCMKCKNPAAAIIKYGPCDDEEYDILLKLLRPQ